MCECNDSKCPVHNGQAECGNIGHVTLYRVDMEDLTGTLFCEPCASDALDCGLFAEHESEHMDAESCPICDGYGYSMGTLGSVTWYRCESCGMEFRV